jgi:hypothetical protein
VLGVRLLEQVANINQYSKGNWEEQQLTLDTLYREQYLVIETITTAAVPWELRRLGLKERQEKIKPYGDPWNKDTKAKYPEHWRLVNPRRGLKKVKKQEEREAQARRDSANLARGEPPRNGLVLPYSNNIGPGNPIRPATNRADLHCAGSRLTLSTS